LNDNVHDIGDVWFGDCDMYETPTQLLVECGVIKRFIVMIKVSVVLDTCVDYLAIYKANLRDKANVYVDIPFCTPYNLSSQAQ
jgi:hypothetical protein